jgi:hypothetical protein
MNVLRTPDDGPWLWVSKAALSQIRTVAGDRENVACLARSVYFAFCELASDCGFQNFSTSKGLIAFRAGLSARTVQRILPELVLAGVIEIQENANGPGTASAYCLLGSPTPSLIVSTPSPAVLRGRLARGDSQSPLYKERKELKEPIQAPVGAGAVSTASKPIPKARKPRDRSPLLDALAAIDGSDPLQVPPKAWSGIASALADIKTVCPGVTVNEISRRSANYRLHHRDATISPHALAKHWAKCDREPARTGAGRPETPLKLIDLKAS